MNEQTYSFIVERFPCLRTEQTKSWNYFSAPDENVTPSTPLCIRRFRYVGNTHYNVYTDDIFGHTVWCGFPSEQEAEQAIEYFRQIYILFT